METMDLMEWLDQTIRPMFLSDLLQPRYRSVVVEQLKQTGDGQFPLAQWEEALRYLCHAKAVPHYESTAQARADCIRRLESGPAGDGPEETQECGQPRLLCRKQ